MMAGAESCPRIAHEDEGEIRRTRQARVSWPPNVAGSNRHRSDAECRFSPRVELVVEIVVGQQRLDDFAGYGLIGW